MMRPLQEVLIEGRGNPPLVMHIIYTLAIGGMENGLVNLINHMPPRRYRHAIVCLTDFTDFKNRIQRDDIPVIALNKREGKDFRVYPRLMKLLFQLKPDVVHTRNFSALEFLVLAAMAGVPGRIHGEHGRDLSELNGLNRKYNYFRKVTRPLVNHYVTVNGDLASWLVQEIGVNTDRVSPIYNGVDTGRFHPATASRSPLGPEGFAPENAIVVGTVGRMEAIKDQATLVNAFLALTETDAVARARLRLVIVGDGRLRREITGRLRDSHASHLAWIPGNLDDIPDVMRGLDLFVLPSRREGTSNTILEAMASGLPVVATRVGGNPELVIEGETGLLVPSGDPDNLAEAMRQYLVNPELLSRHGNAGRQRAVNRFSLHAMVNGYLSVYEKVLGKTACAA